MVDGADLGQLAFAMARSMVARLGLPAVDGTGEQGGQAFPVQPAEVADLEELEGEDQGVMHFSKLVCPFFFPHIRAGKGGGGGVQGVGF